MGLTLTRRWPAAVLAAAFIAALCGLLLAGPALAEDPPTGPGTVQTETPPVDVLPVPDVEAPPVEDVPEVEQPPAPEAPIVEAPPVPEVAPAPIYVEPAPVYVEPAPVYVEPAPVYVEPAPVEEVIPEVAPEPAPETTEAPEPAPEVTEAPAPSPTTAVPVVEADLTKTAGTAGVPEGSPFYLQLIMMVLLVLLGVGYFKLMSHSGRRTQATNVKRPLR